ncbi:MAG: hypothetical protein ABII82_16745 [Verrucomicrobiota bacterium]
MKTLLVVAVLFGLGWWWWRDAPAEWAGMPARHEPVQTKAGLPRAFRHGDYTITPLANYRIEAVVLSRKRYRYDAAAELAPVDLALGWGAMSVAAIINDLNISQSGRWYEFSPDSEDSLDAPEVGLQSANTHCLPADPAVRRQLLAVKRHDIVTLEGWLVEVTGPDGFRWRSSLSRDDTRGGACELLWIKSVHRRKAGQK